MFLFFSLILIIFPGSSLCSRFWIDTADKQPCIGTGGMIPWKLHATGKLFHSGLAHKVKFLIERTVNLKISINAGLNCRIISQDIFKVEMV